MDEKIEELVGVKELVRSLKISRSTLYTILKNNSQFPRPVQMGVKRTLWRRAEITNFLVTGRINNANP